MTTQSIDLNDLYSVADYAERYPRILSQHMLRYQLRNRDENGLGAACVRIGKRLLISDTRYQQWLAKAQEQAVA